jgi:hypothetical protein
VSAGQSIVIALVDCTRWRGDQRSERGATSIAIQ